MTLLGLNSRDVEKVVAICCADKTSTEVLSQLCNLALSALSSLSILVSIHPIYVNRPRATIMLSSIFFLAYVHLCLI